MTGPHTLSCPRFSNGVPQPISRAAPAPHACVVTQNSPPRARVTEGSLGTHVHVYLFPSALWGPETCISPALARDHCQFMLHECAWPLGLWAGHTSVSCSQIHSPQWHVLPVGAPSSVVTAGVPGQGRGAGAVCMWWVLTYCFSLQPRLMPASARMAMAAACWWCVRAGPRDVTGQ